MSGPDLLWIEQGFSIKSSLERGLRANIPEHEWDEDRIHVSDLAVSLNEDDAKCPRELQHRLRGDKRNKDTIGELWMFDHGHRIHNRLFELYLTGKPDNETVIDRECPLEIQGITGRADLLVAYTPTKEEAELYGDHDRLVVIDWKTSRGRAFQYMSGIRPSHEIQVATYVDALDVSLGKVVVADREGQNWILPDQNILPNPGMVDMAIHYTKNIASLEDLLPPLTPKIKINRNKGADSVELGLRWQCEHCKYLDVSCPGGLPEEHRFKGIVGHIPKPGHFLPKKGKEAVREYEDVILAAGGYEDVLSHIFQGHSEREG